MEDLERLDKALVAALVAITNIRIGETSLAQMALPVCLEGLGIRIAKNIALPVFISSLCAVRKLADGILLESNDISAAEGEWG